MSELYHHGILGQKWGVRRYQNYDGTLTREGKLRYVGDPSHKISEFVSTDDLKKLRDIQDDVEKSCNELQGIYKKEVPELLKSKLAYDAFTSSRLENGDENDWIAYDVERAVRLNAPETNKKVGHIFEQIDNYYKEVDSITDKLTKEYGNIKVTELNGYGGSRSTSYEDAFKGKLLRDTQGSSMRYIYNHLYDSGSRFIDSDETDKMIMDYVELHQKGLKELKGKGYIIK